MKHVKEVFFFFGLTKQKSFSVLRDDYEFGRYDSQESMSNAF
jgi:hypothetical protein